MDFVFLDFSAGPIYLEVSVGMIMLKLVWRQPRMGNQDGSFSPLFNPSLLHTSAPRQRGVGRSRYC